jgi:hypothetical protein
MENLEAWFIRHCERSEAIHQALQHSMDFSIAPLLAMTAAT